MPIPPELILDSTRSRQKVNRLAQKGEAFFFITDAWAQQWVVLKISEAHSLGWRWAFGGYASPKASINKSFHFHFEPISFTRYSEAFYHIRQKQIVGETWLANLTFPAKLNTNLTLVEMFHYASAPFRLYIPETLTIFSPERFVKINEDGNIFSYPMKGTICFNKADKALASAAILADAKEFSEHITIVDLIRNDLGMVAQRVIVPRFRFISQVQAQGKHLLQVSSEVTGILKPDWPNQLGDILATLLPAGSVTGAPKERTKQIIQKAEQHERGWYAGVFGYFDGSVLDSAVSIRFVRKATDGTLFYHSGGGITIHSNLHKEYKELQEKIYVPFE